MTACQYGRLSRDLVAFRDVYVRKDRTMIEAARRAKCHRATLYRRLALIPPEFTADIDRSIRLVREAARSGAASSH